MKKPSSINNQGTGLIDKITSFFTFLLKQLVILPIRLYQVLLSPLLGANKCRFQPTCSHYMIGAVQEWGVLKGLWLGLKRISRCHPWGGFGEDPVPKKERKINSL